MNKRNLYTILAITLPVLISCLFFLASIDNYVLTAKEEQQITDVKEELKESAAIIENNLHTLNTMMYNMDIIHQKSEEYNVPMEVILAVMRVESRFDPMATSPDGKNFGLMQINQVHLDGLNDKMEILQIPKNVESGVSLLSALMEKESDLHYVLNSYNMGVTGYQNYVNQTGERTRAYSRTVLRFAEELERSN